jgi:PAS domain S-box-containing protein
VRRRLSPRQPAAPVRSVLEAKLALTEFFLSSDDATRVTQFSLRWLQAHTPVPCALAALASHDGQRFTGAASTGLSSAMVAEFALDLGDRRNPLVAVLRSGESRYFGGGRRHPVTPFDDTPFHALPLSPSASRPPLGLLLVGTRSPELEPEARWVTEVLSDKLARLRDRPGPRGTGYELERRQLFFMLNSVPDPILLTDPTGQLLLANMHAERLFALHGEQSEGRRRAVALNNLFLSSALASAAAGAPAERVAHELVLVDPEDGSDLLFELLTAPVKEAREGTVIVSVLRDVTDLGRAQLQLDENARKLRDAEADIRAERHRLELIMDSVADPIIVTAPTGEISMMNAPAERLLTMEEPAPMDIERRVRSNQAHFSSFATALLVSGSDRPWRGDIGFSDPVSGRALPVEAIAGKILAANGELGGIVTILHDQTETLERVRLFEELKRASDELESKVRVATEELAQQNALLRAQAIALEQASAAKSSFLANMSHELRTPLNAMLGYASMVLQGVYGEPQAGQLRALSRIESNGRHLMGLVNDVLDISRIEAGRMPIQLTEFHADQLIREVTGELEAVIARSPVPVVVEIDPGLAPVTSDRQKVKQIVTNLLSNALKFTQQGSITIRASFDAVAGGFTISVADTGIGVAESERERIFEDFHQVDSSTTKQFGGTGLGLAISRRLAEMLGGRLTLESAQESGSTFTLELPRLARASDDRAAVPAIGVHEREPARSQPVGAQSDYVS